MSYICRHGLIHGRCPECEMGYVPPPQPAPRLNLDRHGLPKDYATYMWLLYKRRVVDESPARLAFLHGPTGDWEHPDLGQQVSYR